VRSSLGPATPRGRDGSFRKTVHNSAATEPRADVEDGSQGGREVEPRPCRKSARAHWPSGARVRRGGAAGAGLRCFQGVPAPAPRRSAVAVTTGAAATAAGARVRRRLPAVPPSRQGSRRPAFVLSPPPSPRGGTGQHSARPRRVSGAGRLASPRFPGRFPGARSERALLCQDGPAGAEQAPGGGSQAAPAATRLAVAAEGGAGRRRRGAGARARVPVPWAQGRRGQEGAPR
jgi:hypothetical protein